MFSSGEQPRKRGVLPYMGYKGINCGPKEYGFIVIFVWNKVLILAILVWNYDWFLHLRELIMKQAWNGALILRVMQVLSNIKFLVRSEIESREYHRFWSEIAQAFQEAGCTPPPNLSQRERTHTPSWVQYP